MKKAAVHKMRPEQEKHLKEIKLQICAMIDKKYRAGQKQHGGDLWKKPQVMEFLLEEVVDLCVYALTLKYQLRYPGVVDPAAKDKDV